MNTSYIFTSESVSEGHPDKVCDLIADSILDAYLEQDTNSRVACEVLCKSDTVVVAGDITSSGVVDHEILARSAINEIGYTDTSEPFNADSVKVVQMVTNQAAEIAQGVNVGRGLDKEQGAGDQGIMFGYATNETPELMPLPILLAHKLAKALAVDRKSGRFKGLRPDAKTQVSVIYSENRPIGISDVLVSTQHDPDLSREAIAEYIADDLAPRVLDNWHARGIRFHVNPTGSFIQGGPSADCGITGRKIIVDTYGGMGRHGGGAFSGKDPTKVDRSGAYFCRYIARQIVKSGLADRAEVQVSYAIGLAKPVSVKVDTFGTGDSQDSLEFVKSFDFRPAAIIEYLDLRRPLYSQTTNYGHFGRNGFSWEK
jgi:S-adenosylmethionine synthetase